MVFIWIKGKEIKNNPNFVWHAWLGLKNIFRSFGLHITCIFFPVFSGLMKIFQVMFSPHFFVWYTWLGMEIPVLVRSLKSSILSSTSFQMGKTFWGVVSAAVEQSRCKSNMVAQGNGKFGPLRPTPGSLQNIHIWLGLIWFSQDLYIFKNKIVRNFPLYVLRPGLKPQVKIDLT